MCEGSGGRAYAKRVIPLLLTNMLSLDTIQHEFQNPPSQEAGRIASVRQLCAAGLSMTEAGMLQSR